MDDSGANHGTVLVFVCPHAIVCGCLVCRKGKTTGMAEGIVFPWFKFFKRIFTGQYII